MMSHKEIVKQKFLEIDESTGRISGYYETFSTTGEKGPYDRYTLWEVVWREADKQYYAYWKEDCPCPMPTNEGYTLILLDLSFDLNAPLSLISELEDSLDISWCEQCKDWFLTDSPCAHVYNCNECCEWYSRESPCEHGIPKENLEESEEE